MSHFPNLGKPFLNNRFSTQPQPSFNSTPNPLALNEINVKNQAHMGLAGFQFPPQDLTGSQKGSNSFNEYDVVRKKVKHFQENISERNREQLPYSNIMRVGLRPEEIQARLLGVQQPPVAGFGLQKTPNNLAYFPQESLTTPPPNLMDPTTQFLLQQYMTKNKQDQMLRENLNSQAAAASLPNESFYPLLMNNLALPNNQLPLEYLRLLEAQQTTFQQIQFLLNQQLIQNYQVPSPGNPALKGGNPLLQSVSNPLFNQQQARNLTNNPHLQSVFSQDNLTIPPKNLTKKSLLPASHGFKKVASNLQSDPTFKGVKIEGANFEPEDGMDELEAIVPQGGRKFEEMAGEEDLTQASSMKDERADFLGSLIKGSQGMKIAAKNRLPQPYKEVFTATVPQKIKDRRQNKWQVAKQIEDPAVDQAQPLNSGGKSAKRNFKVYRKMQMEDFEGEGMETSKTKKKVGGSRQKSNFKKNKNKMEERNSMWMLPNFEQWEKNNQNSIMNSYGKNPADLVLNEEDQKKKETRTGKEFQTEICELDFDHGVPEREPKLIWSPEIFDQESLASYFSRLQNLLGCQDINEEKAIKMLNKKGMIQDDVIVTVKKNEKFYSNFLGVSSIEKDAKHKKSYESK